MDKKPIVIAIDGLSASGKGTLSRRLADNFGFAYLDTGLLYRAVGLSVLRQKGNPNDVVLAENAATAIDAAAILSFADDAALRTNDVSVAASKVASIPSVRAALLKFQQTFCTHPPGNKPGVVLDGRDIGTVIAPDAEVKIFITASTAVRAERRFKELQKRGQNATYAGVLADIKERDARDAERSSAPTKPAIDAVQLDTTDLTAEQAFIAALKIARDRLQLNGAELSSAY